MTRTLVLLRHGRTAWNAIGRAQGHADVGLDELGHAQAAAVAPHVADLGPVALWSSDLLRARETASYVERATGLAATVDVRLREFDVGHRQGLTIAEFAERWPEEHASWVAGDDRVRLPGAEATADVAARIAPALLEALDTLAPGETGVVVTHGAALKVGLVGLLGWPLERSADLRGIGNCAWASVVAADPDGAADASGGGARGVRLASYDQRVPRERDRHGETGVDEV